MVDILDITPAFEAFARAAGLESPLRREQLWREMYVGAHPEIFESFFKTHGAPEGAHAVVRELSRVRERVKTSAIHTRSAVEELDAFVGRSLGLDDEVTPLHVLMVGTLTVNAAVGRVDDRVSVFHCLEWFQSSDGARILVAHEDAHAWHQIALGSAPPESDLAWMTFYEGLAVRASRELVPERSDNDYFWYGHDGFGDWLPWCREHHEELLGRFAAALDQPESVELFFGGGFVEGMWRTGFFLADDLVSGLGGTLAELAALSPEQGAELIRRALAGRAG